ncbi:hypothetical protein CONPUDRAFT_168056 [Coniophora puteana RWD-64-598 SS2]|uniref:Uncharacterized protein n=1 Tax=Coniophora puteana (strain RWD-64-598) TaxID=741705 RepID=A0A5M3MDV0_CONPW|nr:uncharacterized protein CONPUDRAFT_168056 [Coniophora puteana RWD-64-598 SS2]EIW77024.1 hypothetical protein CONPUDRAFT_168056 [Coniophora puteana RWD-64-598 SS2]
MAHPWVDIGYINSTVHRLDAQKLVDHVRITEMLSRLALSMTPMNGPAAHRSQLLTGSRSPHPVQRMHTGANMSNHRDKLDYIRELASTGGVLERAVSQESRPSEMELTTREMTAA